MGAKQGQTIRYQKFNRIEKQFTSHLNRNSSLALSLTNGKFYGCRGLCIYIRKVKSDGENLISCVLNGGPDSR